MSSHSFKVNRAITLRPQASAASDPSDGDIYYSTDGNVYRYITAQSAWFPFSPKELAISGGTGVTLVNATMYVIDMASNSSGTTFTLPAGSIGAYIRCAVIGNSSNGWTATFNTTSSQNIYIAGTTTTSYSLTSKECEIEFYWDTVGSAKWVAITSKLIIAATNTISDASPEIIDNAISGIDALLTQPFSMKRTASRTINLGVNIVSNPATSRNHMSPPSEGVVPYTSGGGNITTPTVSGGYISYGAVNYAVTITAGNYIRVGVFVNNTGIVNFSSGSVGASIGASGTPTSLDGQYAVGEIWFHATGSNIDDVSEGNIIMYPAGTISNPASLGGSETLTNKTLGISTSLDWEGAVLASNTLTPTADKPIQRITSGSTLNLIANPIAGEYKILLNVTGGNLTINHGTGSESGSVKQIYTPNGAPVILPNNASVPVVYDSTLTKWVTAGGSGGGLAVVAITAAAANTTTLSPGIHYVVDMSALSIGTATNVTLPVGASALNLKVSMLGNASNGCALTVQPNGSDKIYQNGAAVNSNYVMNTEGFAEFSWDNTGSTLGNCWEIDSSSVAVSGSSPLDANFDETFIYYTRSDFSVDKKTFFGSVASGAVDNVLGLGKVVFSAASQLFTSADISGATFKLDNPIINTAQVRLLYNTAHIDNTFTFTVTAANATVGAIYTNGTQNYTVLSTITGGTTLSCSGANGIPTASGTLTKVSGTGDATITFSAVVYVTVAVSLDNGSTWNAAYRTEYASNFVIVDFVFATGSQYTTGIKVRVTSGGASELAGFGVDMVQDSTGSYAGDATKEIRVITSGEASSGLITLVSARFTPGAGQLHCNYQGHDFIEPKFVCLGGGAVQFPAGFFAAGDTAVFWVGYGLVNLSNAPVNIGNIAVAGSQRSGTGGYTYSTRTTTVINNTHAAAVSVTLNPGTYMVAAQVSTTSSVAANLAASIYVGGTEVTNRQYNPNSSSGISSAFVQIPIVITAAGTAVALWASISAGTATNNTQEMFITQLN